MQIWNNAVGQGLSSGAVANAKSAITANTKAYAAALRSISTSSAVKAKTNGVDFLVVGIPPLEIVPTTAYQVPSGYSTAKRAQALALMKTLATQFNDELRTFASALSSENKNGKAFFYDLSSLVRPSLSLSLSLPRSLELLFPSLVLTLTSAPSLSLSLAVVLDRVEPEELRHLGRHLGDVLQQLLRTRLLGPDVAPLL